MTKKNVVGRKEQIGFKGFPLEAKTLKFLFEWINIIFYWANIIFYNR